MKIDILLDGSKYLAVMSSGGWVEEAKGNSKEEALFNLTEKINKTINKVSRGSRSQSAGQTKK